MYNKERENRRLYIASATDDVPKLARGLFIPKSIIYTHKDETETNTEISVWYMRPALLLTFSVLLFAVSLGTTGYSIFRSEMSVAAPIVGVGVNEYNPNPLQYGIKINTNTENSYESSKTSLINQQENFVAVDLEKMQLEYYKEGVKIDTINILTKGERGSWWETESGLYKVDQKKKRRYSSFGNIYLPWSVSFGGNFYISGIPFYTDGTDVTDRFSGGGIRLSNEDAEKLYNSLSVGTQVLVYEKGIAKDEFVYQVKVKGIHAQHYLVADLKNNTVLTASDFDEKVPIASLTKLMTALVATNNIELDKNILINDKTNVFVSTLIPRLRDSSSVSMYSLLQLLLVESSNEASEVIASVLGRDKFIVAMNEQAAAIGMTNTTFTDPSGLDDGNVSTVSDLFKLIQYISDNKGFILQLTANQHLPTAYANGQFGPLENFNRIENTDFVAGKVGETKAAGQTSISLHKILVQGEERTVAIFLLGTDERTADVKRLLIYLKNNFRE